MHGDAAFTGQGIVAETLWLSELESYRTGGTIHIIVNNQIGLHDVAGVLPVHAVSQRRGEGHPGPGVPRERRRSGGRRAGGAARHRVPPALPQGRLHRPGLLPEARAQRAGRPDVHAARDVPHDRGAPLAVDPVRDRLVAAGVLAAEDADRRIKEFRELLVDAQSYARDFMPRQQIFVFGGLWKGLGWAGDDWSANTAVPEPVLHEIAAALVRVPDGFHVNPKVLRIMEQRAAAVREGGPIDWGGGEALAFGSLVLEGTTVRLSGQDTGRGTFSHRHAVYHDVETGARYVPLANIRPGQGNFLVIDSMLSENAVPRLRVRLQLGRPEQAGGLGGAVRRLRERGAGDHRPVHRQLGIEVAAHERYRAAPAARLRGPGAGALERPARALPAALRRGQHAGGAT